MSKFILERQPDGSWKQRDDNYDAPAMVMHSHVNAIEEDMHKHYREHNSLVGGLRPEEQIKRIVIDSDGRMFIHTDTKGR